LPNRKGQPNPRLGLLPYGNPKPVALAMISDKNVKVEQSGRKIAIIPKWLLQHLFFILKM
jgi:hypothetical protein